MEKDKILNNAYSQNRLWPQVHSAVDVYLKRRGADADGYELTWRLIHIWECVSITLAEAATARLIAMDNRISDLRAIREKAYGRSWNEGDGAIKTTVGALNGSIDKWIEILEYLASIEPSDSRFLGTLAGFLNSDTRDDKVDLPIDLEPLLASWSRACDVPTGLKPERTSVKAALKAVNVFRNRFAHVPFPYDPIQEIYRALHHCTIQLFSAPHGADTAGGALTGSIAFRNSIIKGSTTQENRISSIDASAAPHFVYGLTKSSAEEAWPADLFIHVDKMLRPYVLTRLRNDAGLWEYTRYLAESNAVVTINDTRLFDTFEIPCESEYRASVDTTGDEGFDSDGHDDPQRTVQVQEEPPITVENMGDATYLIQQRNFEPAITYLAERVDKNPHYHVGWLKLGHAKREYAVDLHHSTQESSQQVLQLLKESLSAFDHAKRHIERQYRADAFYNASKSWCRLWQFDNERGSLDQAIDEAETAYKTYPDSRFESWLEYLHELQRSVPEMRRGE